jgi:hypothetical protein
MYRIIIALSFAFIFMSSAYSQDTIDFATVNNKTFKYTNAAKWDSVVYYGNIGLKSNLDFFYLRERLGMAYYYKQNFVKAISHFQKALKFNSEDPYSKKMLYLSYLYAGRENDAQYMGCLLSDTAKKEVKLNKFSLLKNVYLESGYSIADNFQNNEKTEVAGKEKILGEADLNGNISYKGLSLKHGLGKRISVFHSFQLLKEDKENIIENTEYKPNGMNITEYDTTYYVPPPPYGGRYNHDTIYTHSVKIEPFDTIIHRKYNLSQIKYYLNCNILLSKGLVFSPFIHIIHVNYNQLKTKVQSYNYQTTDTVYTHTTIFGSNPAPPPLYTLIDTVFVTTNQRNIVLNKYLYELSDTSFNNYVYGFSLFQRIQNFNMGIFGSASNLNGLKQQEAGLSITWFPLGNLNLYLNTVLTAFKESNKQNLIYHQMIGTKIFKFLWLEGFVTLGEMTNFSENNGSLVYNTSDYIKFRCGLSPIIVFKKFQILLNYQYIRNAGNYMTYTSPSTYQENKLSYQTHIIYTGIKWWF